jgi:pimeloyl-ACP methyl ester carboxylesterase
MRWYGTKRKHVDTVTFVHGILGHYIRTWGQFPKLLVEDDDLPELDVLLWGYRTGYFARHNPLHQEGGRLVTTLEGCITDGNDIALVGHSMGGLIILKGLVDRMGSKAAQCAPCHAVTWITLFASPLNGVWLAGFARRWLVLPLHLLRSLHKHLHALTRGEGQFVDDLMRQVRRRIYEPAVEDEFNRKIPLRIVAASRDRVVDEADRDFALAPYTNPAAQQLDETHRSVKLPRDAADLRYRVLAIDLQKGFIRNFRRLARTAVDASLAEEERQLALLEMARRYGKIIRRRVRDKVGPLEHRQNAEEEVLHLLANYGSVSNLPIYMLADRAIEILLLRRPEWR